MTVAKEKLAATIETMESYLTHLQNLNLQIANDPQGIEKLFRYIEEQKNVFENSQEQVSLFLGEKAFYKNDYEQALICYMKARSVPSFEFFSIRASAHISFGRGDLEKAEYFIDKALEIMPLDYPTLLLQIEVCKKNKKQTDEIEKKIETLKKNNPLLENRDTDPLEAIEETPTNQLIANQLGVDSDAERALERCIQNFQQREAKLLQNYIEESKKKTQSLVQDKTLYILDSWTQKKCSPSTKYHPLLTEHSGQNSSGFFIRWNGRGIVINPGPHFLENFHDQGFHIQDIHDVIISREHVRAYADVTRIYDLNYQLNKVNPELHVIHYYLNHKAYQAISHQLTPNFKQERDTIHSLELFVDSPDVEKQELGKGITLNYFSISSKGHFFSKADFKERGSEASSLGIRLDLTAQEEGSEEMFSRHIGYVSGASWSPLLAHHLGTCDLLIAGFGETEANDYGKLHYHTNCLGYYGTYTLLEEIKPQLLLCVEFEGRDGDIRLEVVKKLRKEYYKANPPSQQNPMILPADHGFLLNLQSFQVGCSVSQSFLDLNEIKVIKTSEAFGGLCYLSANSIL